MRRHKPRLDEVVEAESCLHLPGVDSERLAMSEVVDEMFVRSEEMVGRTVFLFFHLFICSSFTSLRLGSFQLDPWPMANFVFPSFCIAKCMGEDDGRKCFLTQSCFFHV